MVLFMQLSYSAISWLLGQERCTDPTLAKLTTPFPAHPVCCACICTQGDLKCRDLLAGWY